MSIHQIPKAYNFIKYHTSTWIRLGSFLKLSQIQHVDNVFHNKFILSLRMCILLYVPNGVKLCFRLSDLIHLEFDSGK